jgi:hypothetical protein
MSKGGSEKSMDSGSDIIFTRKKRAIGPSQPPEMMSSRDTFSEEFYSAQGSRGVAALKDKDRLIRDHVIHRNRWEWSKLASTYRDRSKCSLMHVPSKEPAVQRHKLCNAHNVHRFAIEKQLRKKEHEEH